MRHLQRTVVAFGALGVLFWGTAHLSAGVFPNPVCSVDNPVAGAMGDFNGDGRLDLVTVSEWHDHVSIMLGQGDGTLGAETQFATGDWPQDVAVGDLDGDGALDLITANKNDFSISVLLGNGDGTFGAFSNFFAGQYPTAVAIDDLSGDSVPDVVVAAKGMDSLAVLLGNGDGTFGAATLISTMYAPIHVVIDDVDLDGVLDLVAMNSGTLTVAVFVGQGGGLFTAPPRYYGVGSTSLVSGDFNGDGAPDLATGDGAVLLNDGHGVFITTRIDASGALVADDINGDDVTDLITMRNVGERSINLLLANGDGTFAPAVSYEIYADRVVLGDMDGNGAVDLTTLETEENIAVVWSGNGDGTLALPPVYYAGESRGGLRTADLNGDGVLDFVVTNSLENGEVSILLGQGDASYAAPFSYAVGSVPDPAALGDVNNDGVLDIVTPSWQDDEVSVLLGVGDGTFNSASTFGVHENPRRVAIGDVNADGNADLVLTTDDGWYDLDVNVLLGAGDGTFGAPQPHRAHDTIVDLTLADLNNDGALDVVAPNTDWDFIDRGAVSVFMNNGDGTYAPEVRYLAGGKILTVSVNDFNHDGVLDIAAGNWGFPAVLVWLGNGDGTFGTIAEYGIGRAGNGGITSADFDGDGEIDLMTDGSLLFGRGDGTFGDMARFYFGGGLPADYNEDGRIDLVTGNSEGLWILLNQSEPECPGDLDGDRDVDQADLGILLASYGDDAGGDIDGDGDTDQADLGALLGNYGEDC